MVDSRGGGFLGGMLFLGQDDICNIGVLFLNRYGIFFFNHHWVFLLNHWRVSFFYRCSCRGLFLFDHSLLFLLSLGQDR